MQGFFSLSIKRLELFGLALGEEPCISALSIAGKLLSCLLCSLAESYVIIGTKLSRTLLSCDIILAIVEDNYLILAIGNLKVSAILEDSEDSLKADGESNCGEPSIVRHVTKQPFQ